MRIRDWDEVLTVNTDGSLDVIERLSIKFTGRWSRIQRDISLRPTTAGGRPPLDIRRISVTDADGQPLRVEVYSGARYKGGGSGGLHVGIWITPYPINEDRTVIIRYHVTNLRNSDICNSESGSTYGFLSAIADCSTGESSSS
jgi:hypothetical protein